MIPDRGGLFARFIAELVLNVVTFGGWACAKVFIKHQIIEICIRAGSQLLVTLIFCSD